MTGPSSQELWASPSTAGNSVAALSLRTSEQQPRLMTQGAHPGTVTRHPECWSCPPWVKCWGQSWGSGVSALPGILVGGWTCPKGGPTS